MGSTSIRPGDFRVTRLTKRKSDGLVGGEARGTALPAATAASRPPMTSWLLGLLGELAPAEGGHLVEGRSRRRVVGAAGRTAQPAWQRSESEERPSRAGGYSWRDKTPGRGGEREGRRAPTHGDGVALADLVLRQSRVEQRIPAPRPWQPARPNRRYVIATQSHKGGPSPRRRRPPIPVNARFIRSPGRLSNDFPVSGGDVDVPSCDSSSVLEARGYREEHDHPPDNRDQRQQVVDQQPKDEDPVRPGTRREEVAYRVPQPMDGKEPGPSRARWDRQPPG